MSRASDTKTRISVTIIPVVNTMLEKMSERTGVSKSEIVEDALKAYLSKRLEEDARALSSMDFSDLPSENEWLSIQSETSL